MMTRNPARWLLAVLAAILLASAPASADIRSFNTAMGNQDYKAAAAAAASAWPTLDKARDDYAIIAREFGFAAYLAGDYAAAKTYGEAAALASEALNEEPVYRANSNVLFRLAEHRLKPTDDSREALSAAITERRTDPSLDLITFFAADAVTAYDFEKGRWSNTAASSAVGEALTANAGAEFRLMHLRFALYHASANYMANQNFETHLKLASLSRKLIETIAAVPTEQEADELVPLYYEVEAWSDITQSHLRNYKRVTDWTAYHDNWAAYRKTDVYKSAMARINRGSTLNACRMEPTSRSEMPRVPRDQRFRDMIGAVIVSMELNANGRSSNPQILAAVPNKDFGAAAVKNIPGMMFKRSKDAEQDCSIAQKGYIFTIIFQLD